MLTECLVPTNSLVVVQVNATFKDTAVEAIKQYITDTLKSTPVVTKYNGITGGEAMIVTVFVRED